MLPYIMITEVPVEPNWGGWSYSIEELSYLMEERVGETFYLWNGRLYEQEEE